MKFTGLIIKNMLVPLIILIIFLMGWNMGMKIKRSKSNEPLFKCVTALSQCAFKYTETTELLDNHYCKMPQSELVDIKYFCNGD